MVSEKQEDQIIVIFHQGFLPSSPTNWLNSVFNKVLSIEVAMYAILGCDIFLADNKNQRKVITID